MNIKIRHVVAALIAGLWGSTAAFATPVTLHVENNTESVLFSTVHGQLGPDLTGGISIDLPYGPAVVGGCTLPGGSIPPTCAVLFYSKTPGSGDGSGRSGVLFAIAVVDLETGDFDVTNVPSADFTLSSTNDGITVSVFLEDAF